MTNGWRIFGSSSEACQLMVVQFCVCFAGRNDNEVADRQWEVKPSCLRRWILPIRLLDGLKAKDGKDFDQAYDQGQVKAHQDAIAVRC